MKPIRVLIADDHTVLRQGVALLLREDNMCEIVAEAGDGIEAVEMARATNPDVAIIDLAMPRLNGLETVRRIREALPETRVLVLTHHAEKEYVLPIIEVGAHGYLVKSGNSAELKRAVAALHDGQAYFDSHASAAIVEHGSGEAIAGPYGDLLPREREVMHLVCDGATTKEIARALNIAVKTAENHRYRVLSKLGLSNTAELVRYAARRGLIR